MNCNSLHKHISGYMDGRLSKEMQAKFNQHITSCPDCQSLMLRLETSMNTLENDRISEANPFFVNRVMAKLENKAQKQPNFEITGIPFMVSALKTAVIAAAIVIGVFVGVNLSGSFSSSYERDDYLQAFGESHYLLESNYTLEDLFLTENGEEN